MAVYLFARSAGVCSKAEMAHKSGIMPKRRTRAMSKDRDRERKPKFDPGHKSKNKAEEFERLTPYALGVCIAIEVCVAGHNL